MGDSFRDELTAALSEAGITETTDMFPDDEETVEDFEDDVSEDGDEPEDTESEEDGDGEPEADDETEELEEDGEPEETAIPAPQSWKSDIVDKHWAELPDDVKAYIKERELQATKKINEQAEIVKSLEGLSGLFTDEDKAQLKTAKMSEKQWVDSMKALERAFAADPEGTLKQIAASRGIALGDSGNANSEMMMLQKQVAQLTAKLNSQEIQKEKAALKEVETAVNDFVSATDDKGKLLHPHFDKVKEEMSLLIDSGKADTLEQAYLKAVRLNDELYQEDLKAKLEKGKAESLSDKKVKAMKARKASKSVKNSTASAKDQKSEYSSFKDEAMARAKKAGLL